MTLIIGVVVALAIGLSLWFLFHVPLAKPAAVSGEQSNLKMTPAEQAYLKNITHGEDRPEPRGKLPPSGSDDPFGRSG